MSSAVGVGALALGPDLWRAAASQEVRAEAGPYGRLASQPDANGLLLPEGFVSRVVAVGGEPVQGTDLAWPRYPDGAATFADGDGWFHAVNHEDPAPGEGGVSVIRYGPAGEIVDAYSILEGTRTNCAGGPTPWNTWLSCEEYDDGPGEAGGVWECDPTAPGQGELRPALGRFQHEAVTVDDDGQRLYLTEDTPDGRFYRFTPTAYPDLTTGVLEAAAVTNDGSVAWVEVPDPSAERTPVRQQVPGATVFDGGEGCRYDGGIVYFTTKGDDRVWAHDVDLETITVLYDAGASDDLPLRGVDNITVEAGSGDLYIAEDGDDMQIVMITAAGVVAPVVQVADEPLPPDPVPSEVTGPAFDPAGTRLYFSSQRGGTDQRGMTYEVSGPFRGASIRSAADRSSDGGDFPTAPVVGGAAAAVIAAGAAVWGFRSRGGEETEG